MNKLTYLPAIIVLCGLFFGCLNPAQQSSNKVKINNQGVNIAYTDTGKGDTTLLFVHGWCINKGYWANQVAYFAKRYRVVTMDLPGFGQSGKNRDVWNARTFAGDVDAVINQLNLKNVVLIGHSMAGDIVVETAIKNPERVIALVGIDNFKSVGIGAPPSAKDRAEYAKAIDSLKHHFKAIATDYITKQLFSKTTADSIKKRVLNDALTSDTTIAAACMEQDDLDGAAELKKAGKPLYLINSDVNPTDTSGLHARHIVSHLMYIKGTGHYPMIEQPVQFNALLLRAVQSMKQ